MRSHPLPPQRPLSLVGEAADAELPFLWTGWRTLLLASTLISSAGTLVALLLGTADHWDIYIDRPFYGLLLVCNASVAWMSWRGSKNMVRLTQWVFLGCALWLLTKLVLMLGFIHTPRAFLRELTESLVWLPTLFGWGLMSTVSHRTSQILRLAVLLLLLLCLGGGMAWSLWHGWQPDVIQALLQLMLSTVAGYLGMEYFMSRVERLRYGQGEREALARLAYTDLLTELPNRLQLQQELEQKVALQRPFAVLFVDVDSFKVINDTLGHEAGDLLLRQVAGTLRTGTEGHCQTFRLSGDEFVVLLDDQTEAQAIAMAQRWQDTLQNSPAPQGSAVTSLSIGISLYPDDAVTPEELLRHADSAMYAVKRSGRGQIRRYQSEYDAQTERFQEIAQALNQQVGAEDFFPAYQPIYDLHTLQPVKIEALLRWRHPQLGQVSPAEFIPVAERIGQINFIGQWVLEKACQDALAWPELKLSVNVSPVQLIRADYAAQVRAALHAAGFPAKRLELELTETAALYEDPRIWANLEALYQLGIGVSLDDFGAGYSNLSRLQSLRLSGVKLDRSLMEHLPHEEGGFSQLLTQAAVLLARYQQLPVTAEGLETGAHIDMARHLGCTLGQGYALSYPLSAEQLTALLSELRESTANPVSALDL